MPSVDPAASRGRPGLRREVSRRTGRGLRETLGSPGLAEGSVASVSAFDCAGWFASNRPTYLHGGIPRQIGANSMGHSAAMVSTLVLRVPDDDRRPRS